MRRLGASRKGVGRPIGGDPLSQAPEVDTLSTLPVARSRTALRDALASWRAAGERIGLVPTMGALHEGHLSLVRLARTGAHKVVASLFVNPAQFGPGEDFTTYPRDEARDAALLQAAGCDLLYAPDAGEIYPPGFATAVAVSGVTAEMEGAARPGHFAGVATVVTKLLIQASPDIVVFGEKDYQQLQTIRRLALDLDLPVEILAAPIVRDVDGLALSSRNAYLTTTQREAAPALQRALRSAKAAIEAGERADETERAGRAAVLAAGFDAVDYFELRRADDLMRLGPGPVGGSARLLSAARLGRTRLLDNVAVNS
jgi:pantoate--beta-alanine ligase